MEAKGFVITMAGRLLPALSQKMTTKSTNKSVFTNLLGRTSPSNNRDEKLASSPRFVKVKKTKDTFEPPVKSRVFKTEQNLKPRIPKPSIDDSKLLETENTVKKPLGRLIKPSEASVKRAALGDRKISQEGRSVLTWQNPRALLGQTVKGRYKIAEKLNQDQTSIAYLAEDTIVEGKKVIVRVLMQETARDDFQDTVLAEERISLSHVNHPNVVKVVDSGELPEGKAFVITEYEAGKTVEDILNQADSINPMRTARIIRQASRALGEVHQNGILHRNLKPEHIVLMISEAGIEQAKVTDFCVSDGTPKIDNLAYKSPEQLGRQLPTFASDSYSLAVAAFRMLTGQMPFNDTSERALLKAQKAGLKTLPSKIKPEIPKIIDSILEKALAYDPVDRYSNVRDFGEAFFNALTSSASWEETEEDSVNDLEIESTTVVPDISIAANEEITSEASVSIEQEAAPIVNTSDTKTDTEDLPWKRRSMEAETEPNALWKVFRVAIPLLIIACAVTALVIFVKRNLNQPSLQDTNQTKEIGAKKTIQDGVKDANVPNDDIETPPPARDIKRPLNSRFFENSKLSINKELVKNFRGFTVYYPEKWKKNVGEKNFLDISKKDKDGLPIEQMLITYYESKGTFGLDKKNFPNLVEKSNKSLKALPIPNYKMISEGNILVNDGWKAYEVKFEGVGTASNGEKLYLWGRRIWIPAARPGVKNGFVITMLATSLSKEVKGVNDVGVKGELSEILNTFEPAQGY